MAKNADADVQITPSSAIIENQVVNGERQIIVYGAGTPSSIITITATSGTNPVRYIYVASALLSPFTSAQVVLTVNESGGTFSHIRTIDVVSVAPTADAEVWIGSVVISGVLGDPGSPHTSRVFSDITADVRAAGGVTADIISGPRLLNAAANSTIDRVSSSGNAILGDIFAPRGAINLVNAGGNIGSSTDSVFIDAKHGIKEVQGNSIWAHLDSTYDSDPPTTLGDHVWYVKARTGNFVGSILCNQISSPNSTSGLDIAGSLDADIITRGSVSRPIVASSLAVGRTLSIGGSLSPISMSSSSTITLGAGGLDGHIMINSANGSGTWDGKITVGSITLEPIGEQPDRAPYYERTSAELGGGAVGLAPFKLHLLDSQPPEFLNAEGETMTVRHYGPVTWGLGAVPLKIEYREYNSEFGWIDITEDFAIYAGPTSRDIIVETLTLLDFDIQLQYRITPIRSGTNMLKCVGVGNGSVPVADYEWIVGP